MDMVEIRFDLSGFNEDEKAEIDKLITDIKSRAEEKLGGLRCRVHNQAPKIVLTGTPFENLKMKFEGCCQDIIDEAIMAWATE
jgi:(p)ppGpp synthase/HD superfamily hydrolase